MATPATPIELAYETALQLSTEDRLRLADLLYASVQDDEEEWDAATEGELDEVEASIGSGKMKTYSFEEVRQRVRDKLDGKRDSLL